MTIATTIYLVIEITDNTDRFLMGLSEKKHYVFASYLGFKTTQKHPIELSSQLHLCRSIINHIIETTSQDFMDYLHSISNSSFDSSSVSALFDFKIREHNPELFESQEVYMRFLDYYLQSISS